MGAMTVKRSVNVVFPTDFLSLLLSSSALHSFNISLNRFVYLLVGLGLPQRAK